MSIFQTAIILFYVSLGVKDGSTIPILDHHHEAADSGEHAKADEHAPADHGHVDHGHVDHGAEEKLRAEGHTNNTDKIANPLPHVLMLTAIVVGVSTLGVALAVSQMIFKEFGTLEENEILDQIKAGNVDG